MTTFAPRGYTYNNTPIPYSLFAPENIDDLYDLPFSDVIAVHNGEYFYDVPVFYCDQLHTWFFPSFDTGRCLVFTKLTGALIKARSSSEEWLFDKGI